ncbi:hypothetical protein ACHAQH_006587 [Verticillium albo-atrum]
MASSKILVLGATGPAGIVQNPLLEMDDTERLSSAVSKVNVIISLLGPTGKATGEYPYPGYYTAIMPLMRQHSVKRILALATVSIEDAHDKSSLIRRALATLVKYGFAAAYRTMVNIGRVFQQDAEGLNWTVFRVGMVQGEHDEESWRKNREDPVFPGSVGETGWTWYIKRGALAKWLVDRAEEGDEVLASRMPALSYHKV